MQEERGSGEVLTQLVCVLGGTEGERSCWFSAQHLSQALTPLGTLGPAGVTHASLAASLEDVYFLGRVTG